VPLITVKAATPSIAPGTYLGTLVGIAPKSLVTQYSKNGKPDDFLEWTWDIDGDEITSLTTLATGPKSRIFEYLVALLGADKVQIDAGFEENDLVGKSAMLSIIINDDGFSKVDRIVAAPKASKAPKAVPAAEAVYTAEVSAEDAQALMGTADAPLDDLPF
jgi:hypothetical protein